MISNYVDRYGKNPAGKDYCVGDIHGCFSTLKSALDIIGFDERSDRLFSVGDLVDRGPESDTVLDWLALPWFHAVQGNHEDMAIDYVNSGKQGCENYKMNGGSWLIDMQRDQQNAIVSELAVLPYAIEVETDMGMVGIIHADCACSTWSELVERFADAASKYELRRLTDQCLWARKRIETGDRSGVPDVRAVIVGHTPIIHPLLLGNVYHIDTRGWLPGKGYFTFVDLETLEITLPIPGMTGTADRPQSKLQGPQASANREARQ